MVIKEKVALLAFSLCLFAFSCSSDGIIDYTGTYSNQEEGCSLQLNKDSTFQLKNLPNDVENCFLVEQNKLLSGTWQIVDDELRLAIGDKSNCEMLILGSGTSRRIQLQTQADSDLRIDLILEPQ